MRKKKRNGGGDTIKHVNHFTLVVTCPFFWWYNICVRPLNVVQLLGWRRPIGCLQLQVIFGKRATNYTALLQKLTYEDKASYDSTPPCMLCASKKNVLCASHVHVVCLTNTCCVPRIYMLCASHIHVVCLCVPRIYMMCASRIYVVCLTYIYYIQIYM